MVIAQVDLADLDVADAGAGAGKPRARRHDREAQAGSMPIRLSITRVGA